MSEAHQRIRTLGGDGAVNRVMLRKIYASAQ